MNPIQRQVISLLCLVSLVGLAGCDNGEVIEPTEGPVALADVQYWAYQIQDISGAGAVEALAASGYDMLVVEPTRTDWSGDDKDFDAKDMVDQLKASAASDGIHRKLVIGYINIGEAEDWRWYWTWSASWPQGSPMPADWPDYILVHDPDGWEGNYRVAYWDTRWKDIMIHGQSTHAAADRDYVSVVDELIRDGFDGDAFDDWNASDGYDSENDADLSDYYIEYLDRYLAAGVPVFNCEYALGKASTAYSRSAARGYVAYATRRSLSRLTTTPPPGY